jgi:hypothetical protein
MEWARRVTGTILVLSIAFMLVEIGLLARTARLRLIPRAEAVVQQASATLDRSNATLQVEQDRWDAELRETKKATAAFKDLLDHTDVMLNGKHFDGTSGILADIKKTVETINGNTLVNLDAVVDHSDAAIRRLSNSSDSLLRDADASTAKVGPLLIALTDKVNDPDFDAIITNANKSMANIVGITGDTKQITGDTAAFVHRELAPVKGVWNTIKAFLFEIAGPAAQIATSAK